MPPREEKEDKFPYPSVFELTGPKTYRKKGYMNEGQFLALYDLQPVEQSNEPRSEWRSKLPALHDICWTKKWIQVTLVAWSEEIVKKEKVKWLAIDPLAPKWYLFVRGNLEKNLQFEDRSRCGKICWLIAKLREVPSPARRIFSSGQTLARDRRQSSKKNRTESLDSGKAHSARFWGCHSPVNERN